MFTHKHIVVYSFMRRIRQQELCKLVRFYRSKLFCVWNKFFIKLRILFFFIMFSHLLPKSVNGQLISKFFRQGYCTNQNHLYERNGKISVNVLDRRICTIYYLFLNNFIKFLIFFFLQKGLTDHIFDVGVMGWIRRES